VKKKRVSVEQITAVLQQAERGMVGVAAQATLATCDRRASGTAPASRRSQRHLEHGLRRGRTGGWAEVSDADRAGPLRPAVPRYRRRPAFLARAATPTTAA
jgi:hypothetical protein